MTTRIKIKPTVWNLWNAYQGNKRIAEADSAHALAYRLSSLVSNPEFHGFGADEVSAAWNELIA